jgi:hypothetical protein
LIFKWETLREVGPYDLRYAVPVPGKLYEVELTSGPGVQVWRASDGQQYFCHGLTFGGKEAPGGPISPFSGRPVETIMCSGDDNVQGPEAPLSGRTFMAEQPTTLSEVPARLGGSPLACRLRVKQAEEGRRPQPPGSGEVELENTSSAPIQIELQMSPLQYLNLIVKDAAGKVVSEGHYGDRFSPVAEPYAFRLEPGQKYTHNVALLGTVPEAKRLPGRYTVQAVYQARGLTAASAPLALELPRTQ